MRFLIILSLLLLTSFSSLCSQDDSQALLYDLQGDVFILQEDGSEWFPAKKSGVVKKGDAIWVGKESFAELSLDQDYRNLVRVEQNTKAEIRALNPTDIYLEDGTIYSALDGLMAGQSHIVGTPTAVASARGTHFYAEYESAQQQSQFSLMPHEDSAESQLTVKSQSAEAQGAEVVLNEGEEAIFSGKTETPPQVQKISEQKQAEEKALLDEMAKRVEAAKSQSIDLVVIKPGE